MQFQRLGTTVRMAISGAIVMLALATSMAVAQETGPVYKLYVDGLACPFCAYGVEKQVGGLDNVKSVDISIDEGLVSVTMASGKTLDEASAKQAVSDAGFTLRKFEGAKAQ